ncbi:MAG: hypothetical protein ABSD20_02985, partial [Terriglobales bacterium]
MSQTPGGQTDRREREAAYTLFTASRQLPGGRGDVSLSGFVELHEVKEWLRTEVPKPLCRLRGDIKASPLATDLGWVGTAFDYVLRFYVQKLNPHAKARRWVAEEAQSDSEERGREEIKRARTRLQSYLCQPGEGPPVTDLVYSAAELAQMDLEWRIGRTDNLPIQPTLLDDLGNLLAVVNPRDFRT